MVSSATEQLANNISSAILNQNDPKTVQQGAPAYLILIDGLIAGDPEDQNLLLTGAKLYNAYATIFVADEARAQLLTDKAWEYSKRALCLSHPDTCTQYLQPYEQYTEYLKTTEKSDVPILFAFAASWASWIHTHTDDWNARADLPKVEATIKFVVEKAPNYLQGEPYLYLGVLSIILPPALGGKPEQAKTYFERALTLSKGRNLMIKVIFAERYARMLFNRDLHDRLLNEVLAADPEEPGLTLMNTIAQQQAKLLLESADDYF
jgi:tetratricopeptide (TPR) repeat protein